MRPASLVLLTVTVHRVGRLCVPALRGTTEQPGTLQKWPVLVSLVFVFACWQSMGMFCGGYSCWVSCSDFQFTETISPISSDTAVQVVGQCVENACLESGAGPLFVCSQNGVWSLCIGTDVCVVQDFSQALIEI